MVQNASGLENPISFLKRSLDVSFSQNLLLMHLSLHSSEGYWDQGKASALHQGQERQQTFTNLCTSAMPELAKKFAQHRVPCTSAAHREWMLCFWCWHHACLPGVGEPFAHWGSRWGQIITTFLLGWCQALNVNQWDDKSHHVRGKLHGIRTRNVEVDKAAVVLHVDKWRPDGVSHAQNDIYLKTTSLALVDQGNLSCNLTANVARGSSTQPEISWNRKIFFV